MKIQHLSTLGYTMGLTHWAYKAGEHPASAVMERGYWNDAADMLAVGDWIFVSGPNYALQLYVMQTGKRVVVTLVAAVGRLGELPGPDHPDDYLAELDETVD